MWTAVAISLLCLAADVQATTLAGAQASGKLVSLDPEAVVVQTSSGEERFAAADLLSIVPAAPEKSSAPNPQVWLDLVDGSRLLATSYTVTGGLARAVLVGGQSIDVPTRSIHAVRLNDHSTDLARQSQLPRQWQEIVEGGAAGDLIVIRKLSKPEEEGDSRPSAALDQLEGVLGDVSDDKVQFRFDDQTIPVDRGKVEGLVYFHPAGRELPDPLCLVEESSGSQWNCKTVVLAGDTLQLVTTSGVKAELPWSQALKLDYSAGKIVYLSDLEPETEEWTNYYGTSAASQSLKRLFAPRRDRSFAGGKLKVAGQAYEKGLAVHSRTLLEYRLQGKFQKFYALAGIDERARGGGNVKLVLTLDGKPLGEYQITGDSGEPVTIEHDISGGRKLSLLVDYGEGFDVSDRLHLANARVTK